MIGLMIDRMTRDHFTFSANYMINKKFVGDMLITLWFAFDAISNTLQVYSGIFLLESSHVIANDIQMHHVELLGAIKKHTKGYYEKYLVGKLKLEFIKLPEKVLYKLPNLIKYMESTTDDERAQVCRQAKAEEEEERDERIHTQMGSQRDIRIHGEAGSERDIRYHS